MEERIVDLKHLQYRTGHKKEELLTVVKSGYATSNMLVQCCFDNEEEVEEYVETYGRHIVETFGENEVSVGLEKQGKIVGCVAALRFHVLNEIREDEVNSLEAIKKYSSVVDYLAELDRCAIRKMREEAETHPLYRDFLSHYDSKKLILELGRGCTMVQNGLAKMLPAAYDACRRLNVRFLAGRTTDHGVKSMSSMGGVHVVSMCYHSSATLRPTSQMSARRRELLTTPLEKTGSPPASHFFIVDLMSQKSQL